MESIPCEPPIVLCAIQAHIKSYNHFVNVRTEKNQVTKFFVMAAVTFVTDLMLSQLKVFLLRSVHKSNTIFKPVHKSSNGMLISTCDHSVVDIPSSLRSSCNALPTLRMYYATVAMMKPNLTTKRS